MTDKAGNGDQMSTCGSQDQCKKLAFVFQATGGYQRFSSHRAVSVVMKAAAAACVGRAGGGSD